MIPLTFASERPKHILPSAWIEHAPFVEWLIASHKPHCIVELGVHHGYSFLAMCQAMKKHLSVALGDIGRPMVGVFGIDTWQGDPHAGLYDGKEMRHKIDEILWTDRLPGFTVQTEFDTAAAQCPEPSVIDLIHFDGCHSYQAIRHDWETWQPKLAENAIAMFHDTQCMAPGFGVHRFWREIAEQNRSIEFPFCSGLGVLQARGNPMPELFGASPADKQVIVEFFENQGKQISGRK